MKTLLNIRADSFSYHIKAGHVSAIYSIPDKQAQMLSRDDDDDEKKDLLAGSYIKLTKVDVAYSRLET